MAPGDLAVLIGLTSGLKGRKPLADQTTGRALFPIQHIVEAQIAAPLALLGQVAVLLRTVDPEQAPVLVHEVATAPLLDACHGDAPEMRCPAASHGAADLQQATERRKVGRHP